MAEALRRAKMFEVLIQIRQISHFHLHRHGSFQHTLKSIFL